MKKHLILSLVVLAAFSLSAMAANVSVPFTTSSSVQVSLFADTFQMNGNTGTLTLTDNNTTTNTINSGIFHVGDSGGNVGTLPFVLTYDLTLDGVTHSLSQNAILSVGANFDELTASAGSGPVEFDIPVGSWDVTLDAFDSGQISAFPTDNPIDGQADFVPVPAPVNSAPEPSSFMLLCSGFFGLAALKFRNGRT
jgi:hypothetical protein